MIKDYFYEIVKYPEIVGCVDDGVRNPIVTHQEDGFVYVNRKRFHSINFFFYFLKREWQSMS